MKVSASMKRQQRLIQELEDWKMWQQCPVCGVKEHHACRSPSGKERNGAHKGRKYLRGDNDLYTEL